MATIEFSIAGAQRPIEVRHLVMAGWTGRDSASVEAHIAELALLGVARPRTRPIFYHMGNYLISTGADHQVIGTHTSGEVEAVLVSAPSGLFVGVGSDETDRRVEAYNVNVSKQMCPKAIASELWPMSEVADHWDQLELRAWVTRGAERGLYQEGTVARTMTPADLIAHFTSGGTQLPAGTVMFMGTIPANGKVTGGEGFEIEMHDPVLNRTLKHAIRIHRLPYEE